VVAVVAVVAVTWLRNRVQSARARDAQRCMRGFCGDKNVMSATCTVVVTNSSGASVTVKVFLP
jgi:hypothetical protein